MPPPHTATRGRASTWAMASHSETPRRPTRWGSALLGALSLRHESSCLPSTESVTGGYVLGEDASAYGAFHADFCASAGDVQENVAISDSDLYHLSGGLSFRFRDKITFLLGFVFGR